MASGVLQPSLSTYRASVSLFWTKHPPAPTVSWSPIESSQFYATGLSLSQAHSQARDTSPVLPRKYECIEGGGYVGARKCSQGLRSVHSSRCAHRRLSLAGRIPPPGLARCFQAPAEEDT